MGSNRVGIMFILGWIRKLGIVVYFCRVVFFRVGLG